MWDAPGLAVGVEQIRALKDVGDPIGVYLEHVKWMIEESAKSAHRHRRRAQRVLGSIVVATFVAAALSVVAASSDVAVAAIIAAVLSAFAGAMTTWTRSNRSIEIAGANHQLSMLLDWEYTHFVHHAGPYRPELGGRDPRIFVERCESHTFHLMSEADIFPDKAPTG